MKRKNKIFFFVITTFAIGFSINYSLFKPSKFNFLIANRIYGSPANSAFKDENFYKCVIDAYNNTSASKLSYNDSITDEQLLKITYLLCNTPNTGGITNTSGIEKMANLKMLHLTPFPDNPNSFSSIDLSNNVKLEELYLDDNISLTNIDLSKNTLLKRLYVENIKLSNIDLSKNTALTTLYLSNNNLFNIDLISNTNLEVLTLGNCTNSTVGIDSIGNNISEINLTHNTNLKSLSMCNNKLNSIDLSNNNLLENVNLYNNNIETITFGNNSNLNSLNIAKNNLTNIDLQNLTSLESLYLFNNNLTSIDLSKNTNLKTLKIYNNQLTMIDLNKNLMLDNPGYAPQLKTIKINKFNCNNFLDGDLDLNSILEEKGYSEDLCDLYRTSEFKSIKFKKNSYVILPNETQPIPIDFNYNFKVQEIRTNAYYDVGDGYILTRLDTDLEKIDKNITKSNVDTRYDNNKLIVDYGESLVEEYDIVNYSSDKYDMRNDYFVNNSLASIYDFTLGDINCTNCTLNIDNESNKILIKYRSKILKEYYYITYTSDKYNLDDAYIDVEDNNIELFLSSINCTNCKVYILDGTRDITSGDFNSGYILKIYTDIDVGYSTLIKKYELKFPVSSVSLNNNSLELNLNNKKKFQLVATIKPQAAENKNVTWESSDPSVASVDNNGNVTAHSLGNTTITVKTEEGEFTAECNVIVDELNTYSVSFQGYQEGHAEEFTEGDEISFDTNFTRDGYKLIGYIYDEKKYALTEKIIVPDHDITLEAIWELVIPDVTNNDKYVVEDNYFKNINLNTDILNLDLGLDDIYTVKITKDNREKTSGLIGTGDIINIYLGDTLVTNYTVIIKGDVTGNGKVLIGDVSRAYQYLKKKISMEDCYVKAADVGQVDGVIKIGDISKLYQYLKGKIKNL